MGEDIDAIAVALDYHERTKHAYPDRFAPAPADLEWAHQPEPFRAYAGAPRISLDEVAPGTGHECEWARVRGGEIAAAPLDARAVAQLFYDALAISAWKQDGAAKWALRCNPSSGNLHPVEAYLLCGEIAGLTAEPALLHYAPREHALELRRSLGEHVWGPVAAQLGAGAVIVGLSAIVWREAWKYGERAFRYTMHDVGHALGALAVAARVLGWRTRPLGGVDHPAMARLLALEDQGAVEAERPECLIAVETRPTRERPRSSALTLPPLDRLTPANGTANVLSATHVEWPLLNAVERATRAQGRGLADGPVASPPAFAWSDAGGGARAIVRRRRSAQDMDGHTSLSRAAFFEIARALVPALAPAVQPSGPARVHPVFFVHRVDGLERGLALLVRDPGAESELRRSLALGGDWIRFPDAPDDLPLFAVARGDATRLTRAMNCHQDIAADGAFAVSMLARFEPTLRASGAEAYRAIHWEAGHLGQLLYLEAEAHGVGATGIGCFFDDAVHETLGLTDRTYQAIYSFTVGAPVPDPRVKSLPAYHRP